MTNSPYVQDDSLQHVLVGEDYARVRNSHLLTGKEIVAAGSFSVLFNGETPGSIYRLSTDNATHDFASRAKDKGLAGVVNLLDDYGAVAIYKDDQLYPDYLWLAHLERLTPLESGSAPHQSVAKLLLHLTGEPDGVLLTELGEREAVITALSTAPKDSYTELVLEAMQLVLPEYLHAVDFDLTISNFMIRPGTGEVVMSDPVHGLSEVSGEWHRHLETKPVTFARR